MNKLEALKKYCQVQAYDETFWFISEKITETYLQAEMRKLVFLIEHGTIVDVLKSIRDLKEYIGSEI